jgi:uncharacterized protein
MADLKSGMALEGTVTNVTAFGAFVDVGVHQDGLVHVSQLADRFVKDPHAVVKAGDIVKVRVLEVDMPRKRIALTMRSRDGAQTQERPPRGGEGAAARGPKQAGPQTAPARSEARGALGDALRDALDRRR